MTKSGNQKFPSVTILSDRPTSTGRTVRGLSGPGVIMADEPSIVYVSSKPNESPAWFGHWPLSETDIGEVMKRSAGRSRIAEIQGEEPTQTYVTYDGRIVERPTTFTEEELRDDPELSYIGYPLGHRPAHVRIPYRNVIQTILSDPNHGLTMPDASVNRIAAIRDIRQRYIGLTLREAKDVVEAFIAGKIS